MNTIDELVSKNYPINVYALDQGTTSVETQLNDLYNERDTLSDILNTITIELSSAVIDKSDTMNGFHSIYQNSGGQTEYGPYGVSSVRNWCIDTGNDSGFTVNGMFNTFSILNGDFTSSFPSGSDIICANNTDDQHVKCTITLSQYVSGYNLTTVHTSSHNMITKTITNVYYITGTYNSSTFTDYNLVKYMNDFDFIYDHLNHPMDLTGTYGIKARIQLMEQGQNTINANSNKMAQMDNVYRQYSSWVPVLSGSEIEYINETSFRCDTDKTELFSTDKELLIDCGIDKIKGCKVKSTEYIPLWLNDYTEVTITIDINGYIENEQTSSLPVSALNISFEDNFTTVKYFSNDEYIIIPDVHYVDELTFYLPTDLTSLLPTGTKIIVEYNEDFPKNIRYFTIYEIENKINTYADTTIVNVYDGLPITENISIVNVLGV
jgi:hypothetical protein